jgi:hypothetical protein
MERDTDGVLSVARIWEAACSSLMTLRR